METASTLHSPPATCSASHADEVGTVADLVNVKTIAATIRESAQHVLAVALAREGIVATAEQIAVLAREVGNNSAHVVGCLEVG